MNPNSKFFCFIFLLVFVLASEIHSQAFFTGHITISYIDSTRNGRIIPTEIYYPSDSAGEGVALSMATTDSFPVICFGHGFLMTWDSYKYLWEALSAAGYIIAFPKTEGGISPSHLDLAKDLLCVRNRLQQSGADSVSIFFGRVGAKAAVMGHSMGGGASFLSIPVDSTVTTLINLAAAETNPSAIAAASQISIPSLLIAGENDCVTPVASNQQIMFDSLQSACKYILTIKGGSHCQMADDNFYCALGEATCSPAPSITRQQQHTIILDYLLPWLSYTLNEECSAKMFFDSLITNDTSIYSTGTCQTCNSPTSIQNITSNQEWEVFPNPFSDSFVLRNLNSSPRTVYYELYSVEGLMLQTGSFTSSEFLLRPDKNLICNGIYILRLRKQEVSSRFILIKKE